MEIIMESIKGNARTRIVGRTIRERLKGICDYCGEPLEGREPGYVAAYDAVVCLECYEDHHGDA
jgi:formylmethanofuran dehydrogenase subunit E